MHSKEFVEAIKIAVEQSSIKAIKELLVEPPGRKPDEQLLKRSEWYNKLSEEDKNLVIEIANESVKLSLFGFFCVLDVSAIEGYGDKGVLKLYFEKYNKATLINDPSEEFLHDLYNSLD